MRLGKNERKILLYLLSCKDKATNVTRIQHYFFYNYPNPAIIGSCSLISQAIGTLKKKQLIRRWSKQRFPGRVELTDKGIEKAIEIQKEIQSFIEEWKPFVSEEKVTL